METDTILFAKCIVCQKKKMGTEKMISLEKELEE